MALSRAKSLDGLFLTKKITYSDIISDDSIFLFLNKVRTANGAQSESHDTSSNRPAVTNKSIDYPRCDDFISFVRLYEQNESIKDFLCHTLESYKTVFSMEQPELAMEELVKVIDLICGTYMTDRYDDMILSMKSKRSTSLDCRYNLNAIFEIYTDVIKSPRKQLTVDNKFLPKDLIKASLFTLRPPLIFNTAPRADTERSSDTAPRANTPYCAPRRYSILRCRRY